MINVFLLLSSLSQISNGMNQSTNINCIHVNLVLNTLSNPIFFQNPGTAGEYGALVIFCCSKVKSAFNFFKSNILDSHLIMNSFISLARVKQQPFDIY